MRICQLPPIPRSPLALKCPFPSGSRLTLSVPIYISSIVVNSDMPTLVVGLPVLFSTTLTVNTLVPKRLGLTLKAIVNLLSVVFTVVLYGLAFAVVCCCCAALGVRVPAKTFIKPTQIKTATPNNGSQINICVRRLVSLDSRPSRSFTCWAMDFSAWSDFCF